MEGVIGLRKSSLIVLNFFAIALLVSACQGQTTAPAIPTPIVTPTPAPKLGHCSSNLLPGHLLLKSQTDVHELTCTPNGIIQDKVILTGVGLDFGEVNPDSITISPNGRLLGYIISSSSAPDKIVSQDLQTGAKHTYQMPSDLYSMSPSGTQTVQPVYRTLTGKYHASRYS
jgi:hypothetical protein